MYHHKLVRDKIPDIIRAEGREPDVFQIQNDENYRRALVSKLKEELREYDNYPEGVQPKELVDILEVVRCLAMFHGMSLQMLEQERLAKAHERGDFQGRWFMRHDGR